MEFIKYQNRKYVNKDSVASPYVNLDQPSVTNQGLSVSKYRISKKNLTILRLELVSAY